VQCERAFGCVEAEAANASDDVLYTIRATQTSLTGERSGVVNATTETLLNLNKLNKTAHQFRN